MDKVINQSGQALTEYILLLAILVAAYSVMINGLLNSKIFDRVKEPLVKEFKFTYQYGHPEARGQNDGGPKYIPQERTPENFRIFINPPINE